MKKPVMTRAEYDEQKKASLEFTSSELYDGEPHDDYYVSEKDLSQMFIHEFITAGKDGPMPEDAFDHIVNCLSRITIDDNDEMTKLSLIRAFELEHSSMRNKEARNRMIVLQRSRGMAIKDLASLYNVNERTINRAINGK